MTTPILSAPRLRRWALMFGGLFGTSMAAQSQALNYTAATATNVAGTFTDLGSAGSAISTTSTDDANSAAQSIGFTFSYNGASFTQFVLNTNGLIRLGSAAPSAANMFLTGETGQATGVDPVGSTSAADVNLIMPFNFDLTAGTGTPEYRVATTGTSPNRVCTIQWKNVSDKSGTTRLSQYANFTFQAKLYETSNRVEFVYGVPTISANTAISRFPSVGIKGSGSANGQTVLASKPTGAAAWSTATFITGIYTGATHNFNSTSLPDAGRTYRFDTGTPGVCAGVTNVATANPTATATASAVDITFTAASGATDYSVSLTPTGGTGTPLTGTITTSPLSLSSLTPSTSYTLTITTNCSNGGTSTPVTYVFTSPAASTATPPANNDCAGAITLTPAATCTATTGTTVGATQSLAAIACGGFTGDADDDVWYKFVAAATSQTITVVGAGSFDAVVDVRSGACASTTNIGCADATTAGGTEATTVTGLTVGSTYYVRVYTYGGGSTGTFTICVTNPAAAPANNDCAGAITLTPGTTCTPTTGTTVGATQSLAAIVCANFTGNADDDVWYRFVATSTSHTVTVVGGSASFDAVVDVRSGACASTTNIGCADATAGGGTETTALTGLTVGSTYYVRVYSYGTTTGTFTICVTGGSTATCAGVTNAAVVNAGGTATTASGTLTFTAATGATDYSVTLAETGTTGTPVTLAGSPISLTGLTPNTSYTVTIVTNCSNGGTSSPVTVTFTSGPAVPPPANDNPTGAIALTVSATCTPTTGTTAGATTTTASGYANPGTCGVAANPKDVWYSFTTLAGQTAATVTVTGAPAGLVRVFSAASNAGPFTQVGCAAGSTNNTVAGPVSLTGLTGNTTYYISVSGYGSGDTQGSFTICVTGAAPVCPAPTALSAGSITTTGATLTFTPATGVSSYTVTYTAAGGTAQTQTATGSPVVLTGLTSGTAYTVSIVTNCGTGQTSTAATTTFTTLSPCNAPTALTAGSITTTGATLTFTAPTAGATGYTVTYTAAGGTAQTQTATGSPVVLTGLTSGVAYTVSVVTNCGAGQTSVATTTTFTTLSPCTAVTSLATSNVTTTSATLTFTGASAGTSYTVTYTAAGGTAQTQTATGSPVTLANLTPGTAYTVSVVTNCGSSQVSPSASTTFTTLTPCTAPTALTAGSITTTGATLTFTAPTAGATGYTVTYTAAGGTAQTQTATGSPVVLTGLTSGTVYTVSIVTNCGAGQASAATSTTFTTLSPCNAPTALTAGSITATGATLTFTGASAGTSYTVTYTAAGGTAQTQTATGSPVTLTGLQAGKQYSVSIVTNCGAGQTSSAATTTFTTLAPAPTNAAAGSITASGASISFTAAAGATNYTVTYTAAGGTAQTQTVTGSPVVLTGLTGTTAYTVTIVANYPGGGTSSPVTVTFTTLQGLAVRTTLGGGELAVYPNPAHQAFTVSLPALGAARTAQVELVNALGQTMSRQTISLTAGGTRVPFDATGLAIGVYSVKVRVAGEIAVTRLVIE